MDNWPAYSAQDSYVKRKGRRDPAQAKEAAWTYPALEPGLLHAATLGSSGDDLKWSLAANDKPSSRLQALTGSTLIFPATRPSPVPISKTSVDQSTESGAQYIRTYHPDVDIPAEIIREELLDDFELARETQKFDPYDGELLAAIARPGGTRKRAYLAFPMGDSRSELNISPFSFTQKGGAVFKPTAHPVCKFETPIRQIVASPFTSDQNYGPIISTRTYGSLVFHQVNAALSSGGLDLNELAHLSRSDFDEHHPVDVGILPSLSGAVVVNNRGTVYRVLLHSHGGSPVSVSSNPQPFDEDPYWRLSLGQDDRDCFLASSRNVYRLDLRSSESTDVYATFGRDGYITCLTAPPHESDRLIRAVTTTEILWLDERQTRHPLLSYKHGRSFDRTLQCMSINVSSKSLTFLTSRHNGLVTIYDVSRGDNDLVQSRSCPSALPPLSPGGRNCGHFLFRHPQDMDDSTVAMYAMDPRGSIHGVELGFSAADSQDAPPSSRYDFEWLEDVRLLDDKVGRMKPEYGPMAARAEEVVDLEQAYRALFDVGGESAEIGSVYDVLDRMPSFWQESDIPVEQALTTYDIGFRSGDDPTQAARADFLSESSLNSLRGYRALTQGRVPLKDIERGAGWHFGAAKHLQRTVEDLADDPLQTSEHLSQYNLEQNEYRPGAAIRRESEAREQLALDLSLASDVFTSCPIGQPEPDSKLDAEDTFETMSRAAEAMTLDEAPPALKFSFLRPIPKRPEGIELPSSDDHATSSQGICPTGVRLLLQEWEPKTSASHYSYHDPYNTSSEPRSLQQPRSGTQAIQAASQPKPTHIKSSQLGQQPPAVGAAIANQKQPPAVLPIKPKAPPVVVPSKHEAQPTLRHHQFGDSDAPLAFGTQVQSSQPSMNSQPEMVSTQVLPGPFGGRAPVAKKKPAKKRLGGF